MRLRSRAKRVDAATQRLRIDDRRPILPDLPELMRYRQLAWLLGRRNITVRYRQTLLGAVWIFVGPLMSAGLFSFVFGSVAELPSGGVPYFVFSYAGLLAWNTFSGGLSGASTSVTANAALITKIYFPRLVIPISTVPPTLMNTGISFVIMLVLLLISGVGFTVQMVLLPVWLALALAFGLGLALAFTSASVWFRDINYLTPLITQFLLFLSPVAYSVEAVPENLRNLYLLNPLTTVVEGCRWSLLGAAYLPPAWAIAYTVVLAVVAVVGGVMVFTRFERGFADVI